MLGLEPEIVGLFWIDLHLAHRIDLVHRLCFIRHRAPPPAKSDGAAFAAPSNAAPSVLALLTLFLELAFDRVAILLRASAGGLALGLLRPGLTLLLALLLGLLLLVHDLADLRRGCPQCLRG